MSLGPVQRWQCSRRLLLSPVLKALVYQLRLEETLTSGGMLERAVRIYEGKRRKQGGTISPALGCL
jgi:hypothetical protein